MTKYLVLALCLGFSWLVPAQKEYRLSDIDCLDVAKTFLKWNKVNFNIGAINPFAKEACIPVSDQKNIVNDYAAVMTKLGQAGLSPKAKKDLEIELQKLRTIFAEYGLLKNAHDTDEAAIRMLKMGNIQRLCKYSDKDGNRVFLQLANKLPRSESFYIDRLKIVQRDGKEQYLTLAPNCQVASMEIDSTTINKNVCESVPGEYGSGAENGGDKVKEEEKQKLAQIIMLCSHFFTKANLIQVQPSDKPKAQ